MRHLILCFVLVSGVACKQNKSEKVAPGSAATTAGSAGSGNSSGSEAGSSAGSNAAGSSADSSNAGSGSAGSGAGSMVANAVPDEDVVGRYLKYANGIAPYLMRAGDIAKANKKDPAKTMKALREDEMMKHFVADNQ